jgi:hypothetical protein
MTRFADTIHFEGVGDDKNAVHIHMNNVDTMRGMGHGVELGVRGCSLEPKGGESPTEHFVPLTRGLLKTKDAFEQAHGPDCPILYVPLSVDSYMSLHGGH